MDLSEPPRAATVQATSGASGRSIEGLSEGWSAALELDYALDGARTIPVRRWHNGPLRIQKGLTPEGPGLWHQIVVHPPGGIAGGDRLAVQVSAGPGAQVLLTSPGAAKWLRSAGATASQTVAITVGESASVEWLPAETIVFAGAEVRIHNRFVVAPGATLIAADLISLGRPASDERFTKGHYAALTEVVRQAPLEHGAALPLFTERVAIGGDDPLLTATAGLSGKPQFGSLIAVSPKLDNAAVDRCRALTTQGDLAVTRVGDVLLVRWRGDRIDDGLKTLRAAWAALRPTLLSRPACAPRIWET